MSDFMFMLESHLSPEQNQVVATVAAEAERLGLNAFLTGTAMRDMMAGFPIRTLDFTIEGNAPKLIKALTDKKAAKQLSKNDDAKSGMLLFPGGVPAEIAMARLVRYSKSGGKPKYTPASIREDLLDRDFTVNSIALSLNPGSRGLLLDPANGKGDLDLRELRANSNYTLYDDPARILQMWRLRTRMGLEIGQRTLSQYHNVREAQLEKKIPASSLVEELHQIAEEANISTLLATLDQEGLSVLFCPALAGEKLNLAGFTKLEHALQMIPFGVPFPMERLGLFLLVLTEKLTAKERAQFIQQVRLPKRDVDAWQKLDARAKKLEQKLKSPKLKKGSLIYLALREAPGEEIVYLYLKTANRLVHDRIKNHFQKYLAAILDITDKDIIDKGHTPGTKQFEKAKEELLLAMIDGRIRKPAPVEAEPPPPPGPQHGRIAARR